MATRPLPAVGIPVAGVSHRRRVVSRGIQSLRQQHHHTMAECANQPDTTYDSVADHALTLLPDSEREWLVPQNSLYLRGTEGGHHSNYGGTAHSGLHWRTV
jgi:hypothetical protein